MDETAPRSAVLMAVHPEKARAPTDPAPIRRDASDLQSAKADSPTDAEPRTTFSTCVYQNASLAILTSAEPPRSASDMPEYAKADSPMLVGSPGISARDLHM